MRIGAHDPERLSGGRIKRVDVAAQVSEVGGERRRPMSFRRADADGVADARRGLEAPCHASAFRIERVDVAGIGAKEHAAAGDGGLAVHRGSVRQAECPFQSEIRHLRRGDPRRVRGLEPRVRRVRTPSIPGRPGRWIRELRTGAALIRHALRIARGYAPELAPPDEFRKAALDDVHQIRLCLRVRGGRVHRHCGVDGIRRQFAKRVHIGCLLGACRSGDAGVAVTRGTALLEEANGAGRRLRGCTRSVSEQNSKDTDEQNGSHCHDDSFSYGIQPAILRLTSGPPSQSHDDTDERNRYANHRNGEPRMVVESGREKCDPPHWCRRLTEYSCWANAAWIDFIEKTRPADEFFLKRMSHILLGEDAWFRRIAGATVDPHVWSVLTFEQMRERLAQHRDVYESLLLGDVTRVIDYTRFTGEKYRSPISDILVHLSHHGAHHRAQMATHISARGVTPINTDFIQYCLVNRL